MSKSKSIGEKELELLRFVAARGPVSVGEAAEEFGRPRALSRSTVLTMMERLREKGRFRRKRMLGIYRYSSPVPAEQVLQDVIGSFVEGSLAGSVSPFVSYLAERTEVTEEELAELEQLVAKLQARRIGRKT